MELRHLRAFIAVAEELHFGRAAKRLFMTQQPLSRTIADLEEHLELSLFVRTTRSVKLTEAGRIFLLQARQTLAQHEQAFEVMRQFKQGKVGRLDIAYTGPAWWTILPEVLRVHHERYPHLELIPSEMYTHLQVEALEQKRIQVGFLHPPLASEVVRYEILFREPVLLVLPDTHPLATYTKVPLERLAHESFVLFPRVVGPVIHDELMNLCQGAGFKPTIVQEMLPQQARVELAAKNIGVTFASKSTSRLGIKGVVFRELEGRMPEMLLAVAWHKDVMPSALRIFLEVVREVVTTSSELHHLQT
jgi:DNA-binding transcriptional LysR family regulator